MDMKARMNVIVSLLIGMILVSGVLAQPVTRESSAIAQPTSAVAQPLSDISSDLAPIKTEVLKSNTLVPEFARLRAVDAEVIAANDFLVSKGFSAQTGAANVFGQRETYRTTSKGQKMDETYTLRVQDYAKPGSKDAAAIAQVEVVAGGRSEVYSFSLIAPEGNFEMAEEYQVGETGGIMSVTKANSWWTCVKQQIKERNCGSVCLSSLTSCPTSSWVAYLGCVAAKCGGCFVKASACCACNCKWWCKWAVGCCHR
jgi:hypothetical protein